ncbi:DUF1877 domain-containing protein [Streptomyces sp. S.PB5]|uniref:DUF1877 domain-containing protein n=1 Tax=Streptomyces sp. S.PB5 TaxID=3020844 RepID=UPI0025AF3C29|nr:DUF1877 domain-containing protein [Streptomyces sp. S.PB5]MDN3027301.1 DUF1877 domain-containing protein [Streptomyces sp. S.PB5]
MAVTQQLARVPAEYLVACRTSAEAPSDADPRWDPPSADVLDLDWAPALLERVCELADLDATHLDALRRATDGDPAGDTAIDVGFLDVPPYDIAPFGPPPRALSAQQAARVAELLGEIDLPAVLAGLPSDDAEAGQVIGHGAEKIVGPTRGGVRRRSRCW